MESVGYWTLLNFIYNLCRFSILYNLKPSKNVLYDWYFLGILVILFSRIVIFFSTFKRIQSLEEPTETLWFMTIEVVFMCVLCLTFSHRVLKNMRSGNPIIKIVMGSIFRKKKIELLTTFSFFFVVSCVIHCLMNITQIFALINTENTLDRYIAFYGHLEFTLCLVIESFWLSIFLVLCNFIRNKFSKINEDLSDRHLQNFEGRSLQATLNAIKARFSLPCEFYEMLSSTFQTNAAVFIAWTLALILTIYINPFFFFEMDSILNLNTKWNYLPWETVLILRSCFLISREGKKAYNRLQELLKKNQQEGATSSTEAQDPALNFKIPTMFAFDSKFDFSIFVIGFLFVQSAGYTFLPADRMKCIYDKWRKT